MYEERIMHIILYSGNARTNYMQALNFARNNCFKDVDDLISSAKMNLELAHTYQAEIIREDIIQHHQVTMLEIHAQDHLMTTIILRDLALEIIERDRKNNI